MVEFFKKFLCCTATSVENDIAESKKKSNKIIAALDEIMADKSLFQETLESKQYSYKFTKYIFNADFNGESKDYVFYLVTEESLNQDLYELIYTVDLKANQFRIPVSQAEVKGLLCLAPDAKGEYIIDWHYNLSLTNNVINEHSFKRGNTALSHMSTYLCSCNKEFWDKINAPEKTIEESANPLDTHQRKSIELTR
jgi:hypothetical protein